MKLLSLNSNPAFKLQIVLPVLSSLLLVVILSYSAYTAFFLVLGIGITFFLSKKPLMALAILIMILPFHDTPFFRTPVLGFKGSEPFYLFSFFVIIIGVLNFGQSKKMSRLSVILSILVIGIFAWSVIRSIPNMENINQRFIAEGRERLTLIPYILKTFVRPLLNFIPFILIIKFLRTKKDIDFLFRAIYFSIFLFTLYLIGIYFFKHPIISDAVAVNSTLLERVGMLRNEVANIYILSFPYLVATYFLKKNLLNFFVLILCSLVIAYLYSRTGYVVIFLGIIEFLFLTKRTKYLPVLGALFFLTLPFFSNSILIRIQHGFESRDINEISAGRTGNLWEPLIREYIANPQKLLLGDGRYSIVSSESVSRGLTPNSMLHPHNMYLEQIFDAGLIAFLFVLFIYFIIFNRFWKGLQIIKSNQLINYQAAVITSMISYSIAGMTSFTLFPSSQNFIFWITIALGFSIVGHSE